VAITNKEILEAVEIIKKKLPNGEITLLKKSIEDLQEGQHELKEDIRDLKRQLLDPDDGIVVRVNRNSDFRRDRERRMPEFESALSKFRSVMSWKEGVTKALWILFTAIVGIIGKIVFWDK
jgi:hypothetical protein